MLRMYLPVMTVKKEINFDVAGWMEVDRHSPIKKIKKNKKIKPIWVAPDLTIVYLHPPRIQLSNKTQNTAARTRFNGTFLCTRPKARVICLFMLIAVDVKMDVVQKITYEPPPDC